MQEQFKQSLSTINIHLSDNQLQQLARYADFLSEQNKVMNLTAIDTVDEIYEKHFYDCAMISQFIQANQSVCDVGSGAGFPGVVLAIVRPDIHVVLLEPLQKRCRFLNDLIARLALKNCKVDNRRAEDSADLREKFDVVTARAVANLRILAELCLPLAKVDGHFIAMKGSKGLIELQEAHHALSMLNAQLVQVDETKLYSQDDVRINLVIRKNKKTSLKYPRGYSQIKKKPL